MTVDQDNDPRLLKILFVRAKDVLVTVTQDGEAGLSTIIEECENCLSNRSGRDDVFATILDMIVDHTDNILDQVGYDLESINDSVFQHHQSQARRRLLRRTPRMRNRQLEHILTQLGSNREILVKLRRSVLSFRRMAAFLRDHKPAKALAARLDIFEHDLKSIEEAEADLAATAGFLLDGVVGYIGLLQNTVMNILTLVTLLLTPAMVVGAIYGMNFRIMPELQWAYGYPMALGLIVISTAAMWLWVRTRGL
ncbi:MAG: CorA family divalent cation transporter [Pseudolabrys sp.]